MKKLDLARIAELLVLNYPVSESCREMGIPEVDFWTEMVSDEAVSNGISVAYCMGRDFAQLDKKLSEEASMRGYERGSAEALESWKRERDDMFELKSDLIERILKEAEAENSVEETDV